jgi:hypothetical protein
MIYKALLSSIGTTKSKKNDRMPDATRTTTEH